MSPPHPESGGRARVLVLGGGFGGIGAARKLAIGPADIPTWPRSGRIRVET